MNGPSLFPCLFNDLFFAVAFRHLRGWQVFETAPLFVNCGFRIRDFALLGAQEEAGAQDCSD